MFYVYILYSKTSDVFYVGHSENPWTRLHKHNTTERVTYSLKHKPWKLAAVFETGKTRSEAMLIEQFLKKQKSRKLIEKLVDPLFIPEGKLIQLVRVPQKRD